MEDGLVLKKLVDFMVYRETLLDDGNLIESKRTPDGS